MKKPTISARKVRKIAAKIFSVLCEAREKGETLYSTDLWNRVKAYIWKHYIKYPVTIYFAPLEYLKAKGIISYETNQPIEILG